MKRSDQLIIWVNDHTCSTHTVYLLLWKKKKNPALLHLKKGECLTIHCRN